MNHPRFTFSILIMSAIVSGLYMYSKLSPEPVLNEIVSVELPFNGAVPREITHGDISNKKIIFTFDAGGGVQSLDHILEILEKHSVKGTFFITGKWALENSDLVKKIAFGNHEIFNHSNNHPHLTELDDQQIKTELLETERILTNLTGTTTCPYFRPPYGDRDLHVLKVAAQEGFQSIYWTVDALDWRESEGMTADEVKNRILSNIQPGTIVLMHVGDNITGNILDEVFTTIENMGYKIVSLTQGI